MSILWDFGDQKPLEIEPKSQFTPSANAAFDEFCRQYLNGSNSLFIQPNSAYQASPEPPPPLITTTNIQINTMPNNTGGSQLPPSVYVNRSPQPGQETTVYKPEIEYISVSPEEEEESLEDVLAAYKKSCRSTEIATSSVECSGSLSGELDKFLENMKIEKAECIKKQCVAYFSELADSDEEWKRTEFRSEFVSQQMLIRPPEIRKWLSLKVLACGMRKGVGLPIPVDNFHIDRGDFGDDAGFWSETEQGCACGIADGATGNSRYGYDPGDFSRSLMEQCSEIYATDTGGSVTDARDLLLKAYDVVQDRTCYGSCTACVIELNSSTNEMTAVNVGDSGYCLLRDGQIVHASEPQRISWECPKQLDSYPWKEESRRMGVSYTEILGSETMCDTIEVMKDDVIIISSDGLYDNLEYDQIEAIYKKSKTPMDAAERMVFNSVKYYRKPDDIIVLIACVVENSSFQSRQIFSVAH